MHLLAAVTIGLIVLLALLIGAVASRTPHSNPSHAPGKDLNHHYAQRLTFLDGCTLGVGLATLIFAILVYFHIGPNLDQLRQNPPQPAQSPISQPVTEQNMGGLPVPTPTTTPIQTQQVPQISPPTQPSRPTKRPEIVRSTPTDRLISLLSGPDEPEISRIDQALDDGADVNQTTPSGQTPLMLAASLGDVEAVKALLDYEAPINVRDNDGLTALTYALHSYRGNHDAVVSLLKSNRAVD